MHSPRRCRAMIGVISKVSAVGRGSKVFEQDFQLSFVTVDENKEHGYSKQCSAKKLQEAAQFHGVLKIGRSGQSEIGRSCQERPIGGSVGISP